MTVFFFRPAGGEGAGAAGRAGAAAARGGRRGPDGDHDVGERGVGRAGLAAGPVPRELPQRRGDRALRGPPTRGRPRRRRAPAVPSRAPALLPPPGGRRPQPLRREGVHEQGLHRPGLEQGPAAAEDPGARIQLPLHGRGHLVVPQPVRADVCGGAHGDLVGLLLRRPVQPHQPPEHGVPLRQVEPSHGGRVRGVARRAGFVPGEARAAGAERDQARAGGQARPAHPVPGHGAQRRVLQQHARLQHALHHARQLLRGARRQAPRPRQPAAGVAGVQADGRRRAAAGARAMEGARHMHPLIADRLVDDECKRRTAADHQCTTLPSVCVACTCLLCGLLQKGEYELHSPIYSWINSYSLVNKCYAQHFEKCKFAW